MIKATPQQAELFTRLVHTQTHAYFKEALERCRESLETQQSVDAIRMLQGEANMLRTVLKLIDPTGKQA